MMVVLFALAAIATLVTYAGVRDGGWKLGDEEVVGSAPVFAGLAGGVVAAAGGLGPALGAGAPPEVVLQFAGIAAGHAGSSIIMLVVGEMFAEAEFGPHWQPRLVPPLCKHGGAV